MGSGLNTEVLRSCVVEGSGLNTEVATYFVRLPLPDVEGGRLEVLNGLSCEDVLRIGRRLALLAFADGITDPPLAVDSINLKPGNELGGSKFRACAHTQHVGMYTLPQLAVALCMAP